MNQPTPTPPKEGISKNQIISIQTIISQKGLREEKEVIITGASNGRTCHVGELYFDEARELINVLNSRHGSTEFAGQKMRKHIIAMAHEMQWIKRETKVMPDGSMKPVNNYTDLHHWILKYGYLHKPLNDYTYQELPKLVTAFKNVYATKMGLKNKF